MLDTDELRKALNNDEYWDLAYERLATKPHISDLELGELITIRDFQREEYINAILNGTYEWSIPRKLFIAKHGSQKKRIVYVYDMKDRYLQGVLYRAVSFVAQNCICSNCYSYQVGINTAAAVRYILKHKNGLNYAVKLDIHAYFNSVSKERLIQVINELFPIGIKQTLENLLLTDKAIYRGKIIDDYKSLIPGSPFSSFLANYTLRECDAYFDENNILYARYSDDMIIIADSKEKLESYLEVVKQYLAKYDLEINPDKYEWFTPEDELHFLGLKITDDEHIDISDHSKMKIKKQIHRWCKKARKEIELGNTTYRKAARAVISRINYKNFKCYLDHDNTFGWCHYAFRYITTIQSLRELDFYTKDTLRAMKTGKHNKANIKAVSDEELRELGWVSLVELYKLYKFDFDYYCEIIDLL